jgi:2-polyprenyl-3-methyl-5-hydroxy-6-metoxy-1,4-benzoquinol methylase
MKKLKEKFQLSENFKLEEYDQYMKKNPLEQILMKNIILDKLKYKKNLKIIEFGAGMGRFTKLLLKNSPKINIVLVEPDKNCCLKLNQIRKKYKQIKIIQSLAENYTSKEKYDVIVMATAFHHIPFKEKINFLGIVKNLMKEDSIFLCSDNFLAEYKTMKEREIVLKKSIDKWIKDAKKDKDDKELKMALEMKNLVFRKDFGGEYFICPSKFENYLKKVKLKMKKKVNVTNTDPLDLENYLFVVLK